MKEPKVLILLFAFLLILTACGGDGEIAPVQNSSSSDKEILIIGINESGQDYVFDREPYGDEEYREEVDAIDASDFVVANGATFLQMTSTYESFASSEGFTETSPTTYEYRIQLIAGGPYPEDPEEQYVYAPFPAITDFIIKGTYGKEAKLTWDGTAFKQVE